MVRLSILTMLLAMALSWGSQAHAQSEKGVRIVVTDADRLPLSFRKHERALPDGELDYRAAELLSDLRAAGYATASVDRVQERPDSVFFYLFLGKQYTVSALHVADSIRPLLDGLGWERRRRKPPALSPDALRSAQEAVLRRLEGNGYPYAAVTLGNARIDSASLELELSVERGPFIRFDTIHNVKRANISRGYLATYTGIREGRTYDQALVEAMDARLAELPFLRVTEPSRLWFSNDDKAHVEVFLEDRKVSRFDFLIGVLPNNESTGKVLVTGEAGVSLWNIFGTGKKIEVGWKRLQPKSQQLNVYFDYPYILNTPLGADVRFRLDKRDTSYLDLNWGLGVQYLFRGSDRVRILVNNAQTFVQTADTTFVRTTGRLPDILDQSTLLTGVEAYVERLDYLYNPSRGWELGGSATAGIRKIRRNTAIQSMELGEGRPSPDMLYDSLGTRTAKLEVSWLVNYYLPLASRQVVKLGATGRAVYNRDLLSNELLRLGGNKLLRGFDEESILTSLYNVMTVEYRYLLDRNAYLAVFFDWAYVERRLANSFDRDFPLGFGAGLTFETKAGIFGLSYAVGRQQSNPLDFRSSKIHFGYVNIF